MAEASLVPGSHIRFFSDHLRTISCIVFKTNILLHLHVRPHGIGLGPQACNRTEQTEHVPCSGSARLARSSDWRARRSARLQAWY